ncbi:DUF489 family protein [Buchnera aphidicola (Macrosiphoniella sanborni)]|uniref:High frequency lysogenization protein HflD homolog n=1 Tax=Buchnera aphidicola (Macrosiphoniella sanborni) TaxID=1241865 RepID=A0A4D6YC78_9GAMM|nr:DUF489 family protein [Buchnera aphidicola (Macrosiphoniella sanborni)]
MKNIYSITLSLAGICQSAHLIQTLAYSGICNQNAFNTCLISILKINTNSVIEIYGNHEKNLRIGLKTLISFLTFSNFSHSYIEFITYIFKMITIQKKIKKNHIATSSLRKNILLISNQYNIHSDINIITDQIAELYIKIISSLGSRILIKGLKNFLKNLHIQKKIRCLLFSGIRAIVLWNQYYGNQLQLIYFRKILIKKAKKILFKLNTTT